MSPADFVIFEIEGGSTLLSSDSVVLLEGINISDDVECCYVFA